MSKEPIIVDETAARTERAPEQRVALNPLMAERALHGTGTTSTQKGDTLTNPAGGQNYAPMPAGGSTDEKFRMLENEIRKLNTALDRTTRELEAAKALVDKFLSVISIEGTGQQGTVTISAGNVNVTASQTARMTAPTIEVDAIFDMKLKAGTIDVKGATTKITASNFAHISAGLDAKFDARRVEILPGQFPAARLNDTIPTGINYMMAPVKLFI